MPEAGGAEPPRVIPGARPRYVRAVLIGSAPGRAVGACVVGPGRSSPFPLRDGGGGAAAAAGAGTAGAGTAGRRWAGAVTIPVWTVLLVGPVALHPLRSGAFLAYLPAALRARPR